MHWEVEPINGQSGNATEFVCMRTLKKVSTKFYRNIVPNKSKKTTRIAPKK